MTNAPRPRKTISDLLAVMATLRTPQTGCPWDLEQTFESIAPYTIEEAYEVADAITRGNPIDLRDELGDLLLQVVYHARIAEEAAQFDFSDVVEAIVAKMVRRHPHVFAPDGTPVGPAARAGSVALAKGWWERIKAEEKAQRAAEIAQSGASSTGTPDKAHPDDASLLAAVPVGLPALTRAVKLQDKAAAVGFDWPTLAPVFEKMREELAELEAVALPADPRGTAPAPVDRFAVEEEYGDLLFVIANVGRHLSIDPEAALRRANDKFRRRFAHIEAGLAQQGRTPADATLAEMDALWDAAKALERGE